MIEDQIFIKVKFIESYRGGYTLSTRVAIYHDLRQKSDIEHDILCFFAELSLTTIFFRRTS